jgi:hypothetical protein
MALVHKLGWDPHFMQRSAWFWPLAREAQRFARLPDWPRFADFDALYAQRAAETGAPPLRFADNVRKQDKRGADGCVVLTALYDGRIAVRGEVPTRERDWHDFFNVLCFATFPRAKNALHRRQYAALQGRLTPGTAKLPNARTPEQDALTLFDEGGAVVAATAEAAAVLTTHDCGQETVERLQQQGVARVVPFGHALFEHLVEDLRCPGGCTHVAVVEALPRDPAALVDLVDRCLATALGNPHSFASPRNCSHLRLDTLGISPN